MPKRQSVNRRVEGGPQGDDAYIVLRRLTWGEQEEIQKRVAALTEQGQVKQSEEARAMLAETVVEWNWVGDEAGEEALPQPDHNPDAFKALFDDEITWLMAQISGQETEEKKASSAKT